MRSRTLAICLLLGTGVSAAADVSVGIRVPGVNIGINMPRYPDLVAIPGYPVYYAPEANSNLFFYDGLYWVYADDRWYASSWYNGPWDAMDPESVPYFVLRVPVRYYRRPPVYFRGWAPEAPPRWGEHWGRDWEQHRRGWDRWDRASVPAPAPLPRYQREYSGNRYPDYAQQHALRSQKYRYEPHEPEVRRVYERAPERRAPAQAPVQRTQRDTRNAAPSEPRRPQDQRGAPPNEAHRNEVHPNQAPAGKGNAGREDREGQRDQGPPPRAAEPPRPREQSGGQPGNPPPQDRHDNQDNRDKKRDGDTTRDH